MELEYGIGGFICGVIIWTYIHTCVIKNKVDKILDELKKRKE